MASDETSRNFHTVQVQFQKDNPTVHHLFFKNHHSQDEDKERPNDRTLFVANIPPYCSKRHLQRLFGNDKNVTTVIREAKSSSTERNNPNASIDTQNADQVYSMAYIVYKSSEDLQDRIQQLKSTSTLTMDQAKYHSGVAKWCSAYSAGRPKPVELQKNVDNFMKTYDKQKKEEVEVTTQMEGVPDEDGWITVTRNTKKRVFQRTEQKQQWLKAKEAKKKRQQEQVNFYAFQIRQSKRDHIAELRRKFGEDKERIAKMKAARQFKPY